MHNPHCRNIASFGTKKFTSIYIEQLMKYLYNAVEASSNKFHLFYHIQDWFHQIFQSIILTASRVFSLTRDSMEQDVETQMADNMYKSISDPLLFTNHGTL